MLRYIEIHKSVGPQKRTSQGVKGRCQGGAWESQKDPLWAESIFTLNWWCLMHGTMNQAGQCSDVHRHGSVHSGVDTAPKRGSADGEHLKMYITKKSISFGAKLITICINIY